MEIDSSSEILLKRQPSILMGLLMACLLIPPGASQCAEPENRQPVRSVLNKPARLEPGSMPLGEFLKTIEIQQRIEIRIDAQALEKADISLDDVVEVPKIDIELKPLLESIEKSVGIRYMIEGPVLVITAAPRVGTGRNRTEPDLRISARQADKLLAKERRILTEQRKAPPAKRPLMLVEMIEEQALKQLRPILKVQLLFVERVCRPTAEEMESIRKDGEVALRKVASEHAELQPKIAIVSTNFLRAPGLTDPRRDLRERIADSVIMRLSREQIRNYLEETEARDFAEESAILNNVVAAIDEKLQLNNFQRKKLRAVLAERWKPVWCPSIESSQARDGALPQIPNEIMASMLDSEQLTIWNQTPKQLATPKSIRGFGILGLEFKDTDALEEKRGDE